MTALRAGTSTMRTSSSDEKSTAGRTAIRRWRLGPRSDFSTVPMVKPLGIDAVDAGRHDEVTDGDVGQVRHELHAERRVRIDADRHPAGARALGDGARGRVPVDDELHPGGVRRHRTDDAPHQALGGDHGHVRLHAIGGAAVDGDRHQSRVGVAGDDLGRQRRKGRALAQAERRLQPLGARGERPLLLEPDFEGGHLLAQGLVLLAHAAQGEVAVPGAADAAEDPGRAALKAGEHAEGDAFEHRHAGLRLHLRRDQDEVADHHRAEENPGTLAVGRAGGEVDHGNSVS